VISLVLLWLRAAGLVGQALSLGGTIFALAVLRPSRQRDAVLTLDLVLALITFGALLAAAAQAGVLVALAKALEDDAGWALGAMLGSTVGVIGLVRIAVALLGAAASHALRQDPESSARSALLLVSGAVLAVTGALASHAVGRIDGSLWLVTVGALHQAAAAAWAGGLACATVVALRSAPETPDTWLRPFSALAVAAVAVLALTGVALSLAYIATPAAAIGTSYGAMTLTKVVLFAVMLTMGVLNHRALHGRLAAGRWLTPRAMTVPDPASPPGLNAIASTSGGGSGARRRDALPRSVDRLRPAGRGRARPTGHTGRDPQRAHAPVAPAPGAEPGRALGGHGSR
jgi:copper transport protein